MAQQPTDGDIDFIMSLVPDMVRSEAISRLKGNNNNVEQAVNEYYDSPPEESRKKYRYDDSLFGADRDGTNNSPGVSFQVHSPDELAPTTSGRFDGTMSRPPSRVNNKSPLGNMIDLTTEHAIAGPQNTMYYDNDQDSDLQKAIAASRADVGLPPQETGTTNTDQVHFGPANRPQYESGKWDMVPLGISSQEILLDPEPADRKRDIDVPAFLKPSVADNRLGALITMYHEIPAVREVFLDRERLLDQYGHNPEWWNGKDIELINLLGEIEEAGLPVPVELQRLMAFLDKTDRSYGSVESLANLRDVKKERRRAKDLEPAVMDAWKASSKDNPDGVKKIFSRAVKCEAEENGEGEEFALLELTLPPKDSLNETIYDISDDVLWPPNTDLVDSAYLSHMADVVVFKLGTASVGHKNIDIPAVWYPDRYMKPNREAAWEMRVAQWEVFKELERIAATEERLTSFPARNGKIIKVRDLFSASLKHDKAELKVDETTHRVDHMDAMSFHRSGKTANLSAQLQKLVASIDRKLSALNEEKERALSSLRHLSTLYTEQSDDPDAPKLTKYLLRGVSTTKEVTYICRRAEPDLIEMDLDGDEPKNKGDQWWKIAYITEGSSARVVVNKTSEETVLEAAKTESSNILLVYASEEAMNAEILPLPRPLDYFVKWDNSAFKEEFPTSPKEQPIQVASPGKRKFDDSDCSSPVRESDRDFRNSAEPSMGWNGGVQPASRNLNSRVNGGEEDEVVIGIDPSLLSRDHADDLKGVEMQERVHVPMMSQMRRAESDSASMETIDNMDLDDTVMEDSHTAVESPAVKQVEFKK